jgi:hypothetical protein
MARTRRSRGRRRILWSSLVAFVGGLLLLFYSEPYVDGSRARDWRETVLFEFLRESSVPFTSARRAILEDAARSGRPVSEYLDHGGTESRGHLLPDGNRAAFQALRDGIEGRFDPP